MKVYIAGKITNNPLFIEQFRSQEKFLVDRGFKVMNPSLLPIGFEQEEYLHICKAMIDVCDLVCFMPNWIDSKGCLVEKNSIVIKPINYIYLYSSTNA